MATTPPVKIAVIGVGHLGKNHARVLRELPSAELVAVVDAREKVAKEIAERFHCEALTDYKQLKGRVDAATVVVPTRHHFEVAKWLFENNIHALVEKPMAYTIDECTKLIDLAKKQKRILQVGHIERFNPALKSSTYLKLPKVFQWFTGNIGLHHVHHLSPRIPNYTLQKVHDNHPEFQNVPTITPWQGIKALGLKVYDEERQRLIGWRELRRTRQAASS